MQSSAFIRSIGVLLLFLGVIGYLTWESKIDTLHENSAHEQPEQFMEKNSAHLNILQTKTSAQVKTQLKFDSAREVKNGPGNGKITVTYSRDSKNDFSFQHVGQLLITNEEKIGSEVYSMEKVHGLICRNLNFYLDSFETTGSKLENGFSRIVIGIPCWISEIDKTLHPDTPDWIGDVSFDGPEGKETYAGIQWVQMNWDDGYQRKQESRN